MLQIVEGVLKLEVRVKEDVFPAEIVTYEQ